MFVISNNIGNNKGEKSISSEKYTDIWINCIGMGQKRKKKQNKYTIVGWKSNLTLSYFHLRYA
jgi:hypothetical protein